jgi:hypothetical protein
MQLPHEVEENISELRTLPKILRKLLQEFGSENSKKKPADGGFSLTEQICHLRDLESEGYLTRIITILNEDCPELVDFDGTRIAMERNYQSQDPQAALKVFEENRAASISQLEKVSTIQLQRTGSFGAFGIITLEQLIERMLEHDRSHMAELQTLQIEILQQKPAN